MDTQDFTDTESDLFLAEARVRHDRAEIGRALVNLKSEARASVKPIVNFAVGMAGIILAVMCARRWL